MAPASRSSTPIALVHSCPHATRPGLLVGHARAMSVPGDRPIAFVRRADALADGYSDGELARMVRRGELVRLQRGSYLRASETAQTASARLRAEVTATVAGLRVPAVVASVSAAVLHGLPLWNVHPDRVHVIRPPCSAGSGSARVRVHAARLPDTEVTAVAGMAVTDMTRTVVDLARTLPFESAVVAADAALARGATTSVDLTACLNAMGPVPGSRAAARVLAFADSRSESVGESRSRVRISRLDVPAPDLQVVVRLPDGGPIARCDFGWRELRTLGEFDGRIKYGRLLRRGQSAGDAVYAEKLREDQLRDAGWQVVRWTWSDLGTAHIIGERLQRAFARAGARP